MPKAVVPKNESLVLVVMLDSLSLPTAFDGVC